MTPLGVAIIGCGAVARRHAREVIADPRCRLTGLSDVNPDSCERLLAELVAENLMTGAEAKCVTRQRDVALLAGDQSVQIAIVCTPTALHEPAVTACLTAGQHVLCEKPLAHDRAAIQRMIACADRSGRLLSVAYQRRYQAPYATARHLLLREAHRFGPVLGVHLYVCERWRQTIDGTWRDDPSLAGGYFGDAGSHQVDVCCYIVGQSPVSLRAISDRRGTRVAIATRVWATMTGGAELSANFVGDANAWHEDIRIHATSGDLILSDCKLFRCHDNVTYPVTELLPDRTPIGGLLDALEGKAELATPATCALAAFDWTERVLQAADDAANFVA